MSDILALLKTHFGYDAFRPLQGEIIEHVLAGRDALVLMPTGGGKSLCYQLPALAFPGLTLVVSPLISLMKDQVDSLRANGIMAAFINSSLSAAEIAEVQELARSQWLKILYIAPERLGLGDFRAFLHSLPISLIAIDEAHCISEWGHDFRPEYRNLCMLRNEFASVPVIALTATATEQVRHDIIAQLQLEQGRTFISSFNRPNLSYAVEPKKNSFPVLLQYVRKHSAEPTIVYCFSRNDTEKIAGKLTQAGFHALPYHAGLSGDVRRITQEKFIRDEVSIIVATIAFGMGIDKPDVRLVIHADLPKSVEGYYQETGRAGRDGLPSECVLFFSYGDRAKHERFIADVEDPQAQAAARLKLEDMLKYGDHPLCRRRYLLEYFGEAYHEESCGSCDRCLNPVEEFDATEIVQKILSTILRTGQRFGGQYIVDVLRGSDNQKIRDRGHEKLSVFGIAKDYSVQDLRYIINSLLLKKYIVKSDDEYPVLRVGQRGAQFLKNKETISLPKLAAAKKSLEAVTMEGTPYDEVLFDELRALRKTIADGLGVPPYVIFGNKPLQDMARFYPQSPASLIKISGVGEQKLSSFGEQFLECIRSYAGSRNISEVEPAYASVPIIKEPIYTGGKTYQSTKEFIVQKLSLEHIAQQRGIGVGTVVSHIEKLRDSGELLDIEYLRLPSERFEKIKTAFEAANSSYLRPAKDILGDEYSYDEIRLARLFL